MPDVIDELLVRLKLDTDRQQFQQAESNFAVLRRGLMGFAGVATTALGGVSALTTSMARDRHIFAASAEALNISADSADRLGFALEQAGGSADNAISTLRTMRDLRDQFQFGQGALIDASMFGVDAMAISSAESELEALLELNRQFQGLSDTQRNLALETLGLSGTGIQNLLRGSPGEFESMLELAAELRTLTEEEARISRDLSKSMGELGRAMDEIKDGMVVSFAPGLTEVIDRWGNFLSGEDTGFDDEAHRRSLTSHAGPPPEASNSGGARTRPSANTRNSILRDVEFRRAVAAAERDIGVPPGLLWAQIGQESNYDPRAVSHMGARGLAQIMPDTEQSLEERFGRDLDPFDPMDALMMQTEVMRENFERFGSWDDALRAYNAGWDRDRWNNPETLGYVPGVMGRMQGGGAIHQTNHFHISGNNPREIAEEVQREIVRTADNSRQDMANGVY
ncbi:lytic transglycosylase domain-containing protein [Halomonas sp. H5]|uniref:lytic transglycosylase domain-containing protein n=1 Tax=Halomonas sp. H5 TaxID=3423910 RepID=UPI003D369357